MSDRNQFFAARLCDLLDKWKKQTGKNQAQFCESTGIHQNSLSRYKNGKVYPTEPVLDAICKELGVDKSVFYPQTFEERFTSDESFRRFVFADMEARERKALKESDIDVLFWELLWRKIPYTQTIMPIFESDNEADLLFLKKISDKVWKVFKQDLEFVHNLQEDVTEYITMLLIKKALQQRLSSSSEAAVVPILFDLSKDLIQHSVKESGNGYD